jgi:hypothetical protein
MSDLQTVQTVFYVMGSIFAFVGTLLGGTMLAIMLMERLGHE